VARAGIPLKLSRLVGRALMKDPADRYQSADQMLNDLRAYQRRAESGATALLSSGGCRRSPCWRSPT
jgi:serine/threonine protein kinase